MAPNVTVHFFSAGDINGDPILEITDEDEYFRGLRLTPDLYGLGGWELTLARRVGFFIFDSGGFQPEVFVRFLVHAYSDTDYFYGGVLNKRDQVVVAVDEDGGEIFSIGGTGPKQYLDRYALGIEQLTGAGWNVDLANGVWRFDENATPGRVLVRLIDEDAAASDPSLPDLTISFNAADDSNGDPWADLTTAPGDYEIPIGQSLLQTAWDLEDLGDFITTINLGDVTTPLYRLGAWQAYGEDVSGGSFGAGVGLFREGVNIADKSLVARGVGIRKATHVIIEGKDGVWATAVKPSWSGGYIKWDKIEYTRSSNPTILERAGLRWLRRQDNGDRDLTVEIVPGADESAGLYFPEPGGTLWLGNTVALDSSADGTTHTPLDYSNEDQLVTGFDMELGPAGDTSTDDAKAKSWNLKVKLNGERAGFAQSPDQGPNPVSGGLLCALDEEVDCVDLDEGELTVVPTENGDAEDTGGGQWSGGSYLTPRRFAGTRSYGNQPGDENDFTYEFDPAQVFSAGLRYVFDFWHQSDGDTTSSQIYIGVDGVDEYTGALVNMGTAAGANGSNWTRLRACWTPTADRTGVRWRHVGTYDDDAFVAVDSLQTYSLPVGGGTGSSGRAARCDHTHTLDGLSNVSTAGKADGDVLEWDAGAGAWVPASGGGGAPTSADYLVGTAQAGLSGEIVAGTSPGGELGGTWASPTVDATHSGSTHAAATAAAHPLNTGDPHSQYRLEADDHSHASTGAQGGTVAHSVLTGVTANQHHNEDHKTRHQSGGGDAIKLDDLAAPDDNTDLDVSTSAHGLTPKLPGGTSTFLRGDGAYATPPGTGGAAPLSYTGVYRSTDQNVTGSGTATVLSLDTETHDDNGVWAIGNPTKLVIPAGLNGRKAIVRFKAAWTATVSGNYRHLNILLNGTVIATSFHSDIAAAFSVHQECATKILTLATNDEFTFTFRVDATGIGILGGEFSTWVELMTVD